MKIFKELNKLGYIHYSATTIEELDDLSLNSAERISEQALVLRWFRDKYQASPSIHCMSEQGNSWRYHIPNEGGERNFNTYEEAELGCLKKLIEIVKND